MRLILLSTFLMCGCAIPQNVLVRDIDQSSVHTCRFVGTVSGSSGWGNLMASVGMNNAQSEARNNAAMLGANAIVWTQISGGYSPFVNGNAYYCDK